MKKDVVDAIEEMKGILQRERDRELRQTFVPENTRFFIEDESYITLVLEYKPQARTILFGRDYLSGRERKKTRYTQNIIHQR